MVLGLIIFVRASFFCPDPNSEAAALYGQLLDAGAERPEPSREVLRERLKAHAQEPRGCALWGEKWVRFGTLGGGGLGWTWVGSHILLGC